MKYLAYIFFPLLLVSIYGGCGSGGGGGDSVNRCFSELSDNPCFDPNEGGTMTNVNNQTVEEVLEELEKRQDFVGELELNQIFNTLGRSIFLPPLPSTCRWEDSGLVIKTQRDWVRYSNNCYFRDNFFEFPDIHFSSNMVVVSLDGSKAFGTEIFKVLEFDTELVAVLADTVSDVPSFDSNIFGSSIAEIPRRDKPVSFIRVEEICNSVLNFENSNCISESLLNICERTSCSFRGGRINLREPNCSVVDCTTISCEEIEVTGFNIQTVSGIITDIEFVEDSLLPLGLINVDGENREMSCGLVVE